MLETLFAGRPAVGNTLALMRAADGFVDLVAGKEITKNYATSVNTATTKFNNAAFDFTGGYVGIGAVTDFVWSKDDTFTIEWWQYCIQFNDNNWYMADGIGTTSCFKTYNGSIYLQTEGGSTSAATGSVLALNTWQHVALVQNGGLIKLYVNGVLKMSLTANANFGRATSMLTFGGGNGPYTSRSYMDQLRISKVARYTAAFTPPAAPFVLD